MILKGINMKRLAITLMSIIMLMDFTSAYAWGPKGHDVVAAIAEQHLTPKAKRKINKLLEGKSIVYYSSWMDNIQNSPYWEYGYNKTKTWHYANVDKGLTYETMPKNENGDVVNGLEMLTKEMTENYKELLMGVNIGGCGTIISSLASLITFREYTSHVKGKTAQYIGLFTALNFGFLIVLTLTAIILV